MKLLIGLRAPRNEMEPQVRRPYKGLRGALLLSGLLLMAPACSDDGGAESEADTATDTAAAADDTTPTTLGPTATVTFDHLGGPIEEVFVYQGPGETDFDRVDVGQYLSTERRTALCYALGRTVASDPDMGEPDGISSDVWYLIDGVTGAPEEWAPATYIAEFEAPKEEGNVAECPPELVAP